MKSNSNNSKNLYVLDMFPYPSGEGLHVGHPKGYIATDIYSRMKKMQGYNVIHPMGWDAFGLPAEQYAIKNKIHPSVAVEKNIKNFKSQLEKINLDYNWDRELSTTDPKFYKWTQWIFKQLYKNGLAYESYEPINWCPSCKTGLANEDLDGNVCERCGTIVEKKPLRQWNLAITKYADRLIDDLDTLEKWPVWVKTAQKNWIGRSVGSEIDFKIVGGNKELKFEESPVGGVIGYGTSIDMNAKYEYESKFTIFTTRADTLFGCTYTVLAPEHKLVEELLAKNIIINADEVNKYLEEVKSKTDLERSAEGREKTGVRLDGVMAINPASGTEVPVYIADYVLASYGTGAIMAVPAHDERDFEFAKKYNIEMKDVIAQKFITINGDGVPNENYDTQFRHNILAIVKDTDKNKYILLDWNVTSWKSFVGGGVDGNENYVEASIREVKEETGYSNISYKHKVTTYISNFFNPNKKINYLTQTECVYIEVSGSNILNKEEELKHKLIYLDKDEVEDFLKKSGSDYDYSLYCWDKYLTNDLIDSNDGFLVNSNDFDGMTSEEARIAITEHVGGKIVTKYKLREWVFARQRYWGEPFPIVHEVEKEVEYYDDNFKKGEPYSTRHGVAVLIKKWDEDKYLGIKWKDVNWETLLTGGIEEGEDVLETAKREIKEETGYTNINNIKFISKFSSYFYHEPKKDNRKLIGNFIYCELGSSDKINISKEEESKHELVWLTKEELYNFNLPEPHMILAKRVIESNGNIDTHVKKSYVVADSELPVLLPDVESYEPTGTGESPLADIKSFTDVYGYINDEGEFESVKNYFRFEDKFINDLINGVKSNTIRIDSKNLKVNDVVEIKDSKNESKGYVIIKNIESKKLIELDISNPNGTSYNSKEEQLENYKKYYGDEVNLETQFFIFDFEIFNKEVKLFKRETNTMPQWAGSSWYYLRFLDPNNENDMIDPSIEKDWQVKNVDGNKTVNLYVGGDHATRHLIYARFWHKFLYDIGVVTTVEPFDRLEFLGFILAEDGRKMSKRWGNIINPDDVIAEYGSDTLRVYEMFMAPFDATAVWNTSSIKGVKRFLERVAKLKDKVTSNHCNNESIIHQTVKKVSEDIESFKFNTCVSQLMICLNTFEEEGLSIDEYEKYMTILAPFAPTLCAEYISHEWPTWDENKLLADTVEMALQINGKMRGTFTSPLNADEEEIKSMIKELDIYKKYSVDASGSQLEPKKIIVIPNRLVNVIF